MAKKNILLITFSILIVLSVGYLFWSAERPSQVSWWAISFDEPQDSSLDFWIENHSSEEGFRYEIWKGSELAEEGQVNVGSGNNEKVEITDSFENAENVKIKVFLGDDEKEINKRTISE